MGCVRIAIYIFMVLVVVTLIIDVIKLIFTGSALN